MVLLILGLIMFVGLVVVHEWGHFIMARRNGVEVEEFGIGFPPRLWAKKIKSSKGNYEFSLNALPLGGFVKLKGENDSDQEKGSFGAASLTAKIKIMVAGVFMNLVTAFALLTFVALVGIPKLIDNQFTIASDTKVVDQRLLVGYVEPNSPAEKSGLQVRDQLLSVEDVPVAAPEEFPSITEKYAGQKVDITYKRGEVVNKANVELRGREEVESSKSTDEPKGYLGIAPAEYSIQRSTWSAPIVGAGLIKQFTTETFKGLGAALGNLFRGDTAKASEQVAGPVGIFVILKDGSFLGYQFVLLIIAVISLTLAIMNVLPIPALDGGRLFVTLLFRAIRKPLTKGTEDLIHGTGFALLMLLFLLITVVDIKRFF
jgi:regulator of sigma E protease